MKGIAYSLRSGRNFNYTKFVNKYSVTVAFPTAMGLPFVFTLQNPAVYSAGGRVQVKTHPDLASSGKHQIQIPEVVNASIEVKFVWVLIFLMWVQFILW